MPGVRKIDSLTAGNQVASDKPRNLVVIKDVDDKDYSPSRDELENGLFYFLNVSEDRNFCLPTAHKLAQASQNGFDHLLGHTMPFTVRNVDTSDGADGAGSVHVVMPAGERLHSSVTDLTVGAGQCIHYLLRLEWLEYSDACSPHYTTALASHTCHVGCSCHAIPPRCPGPVPRACLTLYQV